MNRYKVIVRNSPGWRNFDACTLGVSVMSPNWQDDKFASIMEFAAANFKTIRIDVTDALYRHNFMGAGLQPEKAMSCAQAAGALWLTKHQHIIDESPVKPQIIRWSEWYNHPDFADVLAGFQRAHDINPDLRAAVQDDVSEFARRQGSTPSLMEREHSKDYLLEELAVNCLQARALPSVKIYPGDELQCIKLVRAGLIPEAPAGIEREKFAKIKFHARGANPIAAPLMAVKVA